MSFICHATGPHIALDRPIASVPGPATVMAYAALALALASGLAGCADTPQAPTEPVATAAPATETVAAPVEQPAPEPIAQPARLPEDGIVAEFKATQVKLSPETLALLAKFAESRDPNERLEITGYCNKREAPIDARDIATMRANAVRRELIKLGVPAKSIRVKYNTTQPMHAVKMEVKEGTATASTPHTGRIELAEKASPTGPISTAASTQTGCACAAPGAATR